MKIAISANGQALNDKMNSRFGRCPWFLIVDTETKEAEAISNQSAQQARGAGVGAAQTVISAGASAVISSAVGPKAFEVLGSGKVDIYLAPEGLTCAQVLDMFQQGKLSKKEFQVF